jgi:hypothetical protein
LQVVTTRSDWLVHDEQATLLGEIAAGRRPASLPY